VCSFSTIESACGAALRAIQSGIPVARVELVDEQQITICNAYSRRTLAARPTLFFEFHGCEASVRQQSERFGEIAAGFGGSDFE